MLILFYAKEPPPQGMTRRIVIQAPSLSAGLKYAESILASIPVKFAVRTLDPLSNETGVVCQDVAPTIARENTELERLNLGGPDPSKGLSADMLEETTDAMEIF